MHTTKKATDSMEEILAKRLRDDLDAFLADSSFEDEFFAAHRNGAMNPWKKKVFSLVASAAVVALAVGIGLAAYRAWNPSSPTQNDNLVANNGGEFRNNLDEAQIESLANDDGELSELYLETVGDKLADFWPADDDSHLTQRLSNVGVRFENALAAFGTLGFETNRKESGEKRRAADEAEQPSSEENILTQAHDFIFAGNSVLRIDPVIAAFDVFMN